MKILLANTAAGLVPLYDEGWDDKRRLRPGEVYEAEIRPARNVRMHRSYFALVSAAWECLPERTASGFRDREAFRKYLEVAAGWYEPFYSPLRGEWLEVPKSIAFDRMDGDTFRRLYDRVKDVILTVLDGRVTREAFERALGELV